MVMPKSAARGLSTSQEQAEPVAVEIADRQFARRLLAGLFDCDRRQRTIGLVLAGRANRKHITVMAKRPSAFIHTGLTRARGSMFPHFTPADLVAILNIPRLQTLPNSFKILREYRLSVVALVFSR